MAPLFFLCFPPPPTSTLFPYTTLFRSPARLPVRLRRERRPLRSRRARRSRHAHRKHRRSEEHTSELQSRRDLVCRLLLEKKKRSCCAASWAFSRRGAAASASRSGS